MKSITYNLIKNNLINVDEDLFYNNDKENKTNLIEKLLNNCKLDPIYNIKVLLRKIENTIINLDSRDQKLINKYFTNSTTDNNINIKIKFYKNSYELLQKNSKIIIDKDIDEDIGKNINNLSLTKDELPFIIPFNVILTMKDDKYDILDMIEIVKNNPTFLEIFNEQCFIWWNKKNIISLIDKLIQKYITKKSSVYDIAFQFKLSIQNLIDSPKDLLELINNCLKPKTIEKKNFGEVFTPIKLINEMLDKLPIDVWYNKNLKWLDPCSGMGNFPIAIYLRLNETLKEQIPNDADRKKHILNNMLYMCEINKKNVLITKQIFDVNNDFDINIYNGDSLTLNYIQYFNIDKFDIIVGNPPYHMPNSSGDNKLYLSFTKLCINLLKVNGLLLFITPYNILEYLLCTGKNKNYVNDFYQLKFISIETSNKYFPNIGSTFVYFILENQKYYMNTHIEYMFCDKLENKHILLEKGKHLPKILTDIDFEILNKLQSNTNNYQLHNFVFNNNTAQRIRKEHFHKNIISINKTSTHIFKIIDSINISNPFPGVFYYNKHKDTSYGIDKLILSKKGYLMPYVDRTKTYTYSDNFKYIIDDNLDEIKILLESKLIKYLLFQYSKNGYDSIDIIKTINKKSLNNIKNENDLYELYELTDIHINHINKIIN